MENLGSCTLEGRYVRLEPLMKDHVEALYNAGKSSDFTWLSTLLDSVDAVSNWVTDTLRNQEMKREYPFAVVLKDSNRIVGSTRYAGVQYDHHTVEIGYTWYSSDVWGTAVNPESKFLLLRHAFEDWNAIRVQIETDSGNLRSQRAILKLGAKFEGRLRNHRIRRDGTYRDTMMYSITDSDWNIVKNLLKNRIEQFDGK